jgi:hypothetical protein
MRSIRKQWPGRLLAAVLALGLICAAAVGAYAHAAGHHHHGGHGQAVVAATDAAEAAVHVHIGGGSDCQKHKHGSGDSGVAHADCCDLMCHGWTALVGAKFALPVPLLAVTGISPARIAAGVRPASLERPPRPRILA